MREALKLSLFFFVCLAFLPASLTAATGSKVAAGYGFSVAVHDDGTVWSWGDNQYGQAGVPGSVEYHAPVQVVGTGGVGFLTDIAAVDVGFNYTLALKNDGTVWAWGDNSYGQLGIDSTQAYDYPVQVKNSSGTGFLSGVKAIACGSSHALALLNDGTVFAWGRNDRHQINATAGDKSSLPVQYPGLSDIVAVAAGLSFNLVLADDGRVWAWGSNYSGELGDGTTGGYSGIAAVVKSADGAGSLQGITSIGAGGTHSLAVGQDGSGWAWGFGTQGQLGDDSFSDTSLPVRVKGTGGVGFLGDISLMTGGYNHSLALLSDGTVYAWGENGYQGLLGDGTSDSSGVPVQVLDVGSGDPMTDVTAIGSSQYHNLALKKNGKIAAWGGNYYGQLGDGRAGKRILPYMVEGLQNMTAVSGGRSHSLALKDDGTVWVWGRNYYGQLSDGTTEDNSSPQKISGLSNVEAISAGDHFNLALKEDGTVWAWGRNEHGQLTIAPPDTDPHTTPVQVKSNPTTFLTGVKAVAAGGTHALALLTQDSAVKAWGNNLDGQLGITFTYANSSYPIFVAPPPGGSLKLSGVYKIAAGGAHSLAINTNLDRLWTWGDDGGGQLADGLPLDDKYEPVVAIALTGDDYLSDVSGGSDHTLVRTNADRPSVSGDNYWGQLGDGTKDDRSDEYQLSSPTYTSKVAAGEKHSLALTRDTGSVWAWGSNGSGQLGDGTKTEKLSPNLVPDISNITQIAAGGSHSLALMDDGTVWTWGSNEYGQIGDGRVWNERVWVEGLNLLRKSPWVIFLPAILKTE